MTPMRRVPAFAFVVLLLAGCGSAATGSLPPSPVATVPSTTAPSVAQSNTPIAATPAPTPSARPVPSPTPQTYVVRRGDSYISIAKRFGVKSVALTQANPTVRFFFTQTGPDPSHTFPPGVKDIQIGDVLIIPTP